MKLRHIEIVIVTHGDKMGILSEMFPNAVEYQQSRSDIGKWYVYNTAYSRIAEVVFREGDVVYGAGWGLGDESNVCQYVILESEEK